MTQALVTVGRFCPNTACPDYGQLAQGNIVRFGHTPNGAQRYRCKTCGQTLTETKGTLFYRRRTPRKEILETLALLAEGVRISSLSRAKGFKEDTILDWLREAAQHADAVEAILLDDYRVSRAQIDALWAYVGHKGEKGVTRKARRLEASGAVR
jgi:transposase-like protein